MKNLIRFTIGGLVLAGSALVVLPESAVGYSTIGGKLGTGQRDHRLYNNLTASGANNNTVMIANMPGYDGCELATWKAGAEWGARLFGDGTGDTTQTQLGDGGGNFNFFWNGNASGIGGTNDNIHSGLAGSSGGVLAYTETPIADGWRIRYYQNWSWQDGPGTVSSGICFQGVATHELGHSLGLGHSTVNGATMYPSISGTGQVTRSIETDDKNGCQAVYGALAANPMPQIDNVTGSFVPGGSVTITGANFHATNNKVWLDNALVDGGNAGGEPLKIENLASSGGGTVITFTLPGAGGFLAGSIHVKDGTHDNSWAVSEGHPFDAGSGGPIVDTILLTATNLAPPVGSSVTFDISGAPTVSPYTLWYSFTNTGTTINGQPFDIGPPNGAVATGTTSGLGTASKTRTVPNAVAGLTIYLEVQADDLGITYDSNMITLNIP